MSGFRSMSRRVMAGIRNAVSAGVHVVLATGRPVVSTIPVLAELGLVAGNAVCSNGAIRMDVASGELLTVHQFDATVVLDQLRALFPGALFAVERPGAENLTTGLFPVPEMSADRMVDHATLVAEPITRLTVYWDGHTAAELAARFDAERLPGVSCLLDPAAPWLVAVAAGISKGTTLEQLRIELDVPASATLAVGDGDNDVEMLRWAARGVAMGNAPDYVKAVAREVTGTIDDDGLALVLERWF